MSAANPVVKSSLPGTGKVIPVEKPKIILAQRSGGSKNILADKSCDKSGCGFQCGGSKEAAPGHLEYYCRICEETCELGKSKPASSKDPHVRVETVCATNKRNMERRVKQREKGDTLKTWWNGIIRDPKKLAMWARRMKRRGAYSRMTDEELMAESAEVDTQGVEERIRSRFYGFDTLKDENKDLDEEELAEEWRKRLQAAPSVIERDGQTYIERPREIVIDKLKSKMFQNRIGRRMIANDASDLKAIQEKQEESMGRFKRSMMSSFPCPPPKLPEEITEMDVDTLNLDRGPALDRFLDSESHLDSLRKEILAREKQQKEEDEENQRDIEVQRKSKPVPTAEDKDAKSRNRLATVECLLLERQAKLDSTHLMLSKEVEAIGKADLEHIVDPVRKEQAKEAIEKLEKDTKDALKEYFEHIKAFKLKCEKPSEKIGAENLLDLAAIDNFAKRIDDEYRSFFGRGDVISPLRECIRLQKKEVATQKKAAEKQETAALARSAKKRKMGSVDFDPDPKEELPNLAQAIKSHCKEILKGTKANINVSESFSEGKVYFKKGEGDTADNIQKLQEVTQMRLLVKWAKKKLEDSKEPEITTAVMNRKLLTEITKVFAAGEGLHESLQQGTSTALTFPEEYDELKKTVCQYQITMGMSPWWTSNVTSFAIGEVRAQTSDSYALFGLRWRDLEGENIEKKMENISELNEKDFLQLVTNIGFQLWVTPGSLLYIPAGYIIICYCPDEHMEPMYLRWSVLRSKQELSVTKEVIADMLQSYEWLANTDYAALHALMTAND